MIRGTRKIAKVSGKFAKMVNLLNRGIEELRDSKRRNFETIKECELENKTIEMELTSAAKLKDALSQFIQQGAK